MKNDGSGSHSSRGILAHISLTINGYYNVIIVQFISILSIVARVNNKLQHCTLMSYVTWRQ